METNVTLRVYQSTQHKLSHSIEFKKKEWEGIELANKFCHKEEKVTVHGKYIVIRYLQKLTAKYDYSVTLDKVES